MAPYTEAVRAALLAVVCKHENLHRLAGQVGATQNFKLVVERFQTDEDLIDLIQWAAGRVPGDVVRELLQTALDAAHLAGRVPAEDPDDSMLLEMWAGNALQGFLAMHADPEVVAPPPKVAADQAMEYAEALLTEYKRRRTTR